MSTGDPLALLPPEIILRVLDFTPVRGLAALTSTSKDWHAFIDDKHQDVIYASKTVHPSNAHDFSFLKETKSFAKFFEGTSSWKDLCRRQTLLPHSWDDVRPETKESVVQVGNDPVWRFRPDFKRRIFLSTSQAGGLNVTCMDTGKLLWRLPSSLETDNERSARPYAHLEYQDGTAVFDREGDAVEVWRYDDGKAWDERGEFERIAVLPHDCQTRGFQLSFETLCVVSTQGQGFVYDFSVTPPVLRTHLEIEDDAVGHLDQSSDMVMYSMGYRGYHVHDKTTGKFIGAIQPGKCDDLYHIKHPETSSSASTTREAKHGPTARVFPPARLSKARLEPIKPEKGPLPFPLNDEHFPLHEDEWGAGMLHGNLMAGVSRHGRIFICSNWRKYLEVGDGKACASVVECESDGSSFDLGGWLSVKDNRVMFEIQDRVYILALNEDGSMQDTEKLERGSYSYLTSSAPQLAVPVSFMGIYDDCVMHTFTTLGWRQQRIPALAAHHGAQMHDGPARIFPTKAIRVISFAPDLDHEEHPELWEPETEMSASDRAQTGLLQLVSMLGDELNDDDDEVGAMAADFESDTEISDNHLV